MRRTSMLAVLAAALLAVPSAAQNNQGKISIAGDAENVRFGKPLTLSGKLTGKKPTAGQIVEVQSLPAPYTGAYTTVATVVSNDAGDWSAVVTPGATARWRAVGQTTP